MPASANPPTVISASATWNVGSEWGVLLVEFSKAMDEDEIRGNSMKLTGTSGDPIICNSYLLSSPTVKEYDFEGYEAGKAPYTLSYVEHPEEQYRAKAADGTYLQNFAGMPITITEV